MDERCVPKEHSDSNYRSAYERLLSHVPVSETNIHRIRGEDVHDEEARRYEAEIRDVFKTSGFPVFDLIILGMGEDGHTASLFPGAASLQEKERLAIPVYVDKLKSWRITLTLPVLNNARQIVFLVSGESKADLLADVLENSSRGVLYPAGLVDPVNGRVTWLVDQAAAEKLKNR